VLYPACSLRRRLASEGIVTLGRCQAVCVCPPSRLYRVSDGRLGGEENALYPVLSGYKISFVVFCQLLLNCSVLLAAVKRHGGTKKQQRQQNKNLLQSNRPIRPEKVIS